MPRRRSKPKPPEQIAAEAAQRRARAFAAVGLQPEGAHLAMNADVEVRHAERARTNGARRVDAFDALRAGMAAGAYDAVRRLEHDMVVRRGETDRGRALIRIDGGGVHGMGAIDLRLAAGERVAAALSRIGARDAQLLSELIAPTRDHGGWRETVAHVTGEMHVHAQGAVVRSACANLAEAYRDR